MNILDQSIEALAPSWALKRKLARAALKKTRRYDAASIGGPRTKNMLTNSSGPNIDARPSSAKTIAARARYLQGSTRLGSTIIRVVGNETVDSGIVTQWGEGVPERFKEDFLDHCVHSTDIDSEDNYNIYDIQKQLVRTFYRDGSFFVRKRTRRPSDGHSIPIQLQILEREYLDTSMNNFGSKKTGNQTVNGIEYDMLGRPTAYWIFKEHPDDSLWFSRKMQSTRIPASDILHVYNADRFGQKTGISLMAPMILALDEISDSFAFERTRMKVSSCFAAFIKDETAGDDVDSEDVVIDDEIKPGTFHLVPPGSDVKFSSPPQNSGFGEFTKSELFLLSSSAGITYELLTNDYRSYSYSSARAARLSMNKNIREWRGRILTNRALRVINKWILAAYDMKNGTNLYEFAKFKLIAPSQELLDPDKEIRAKVMAVRAGYMSHSEAVYSLGKNAAEVDAEQAADNKRADDLGLIRDDDGRNMTLAGNRVQETETQSEESNSNNNDSED